MKYLFHARKRQNNYLSMLFYCKIESAYKIKAAKSSNKDFVALAIPCKIKCEHNIDECECNKTVLKDRKILLSATIQRVVR